MTTKQKPEHVFSASLSKAYPGMGGEMRRGIVGLAIRAFITPGEIASPPNPKGGSLRALQQEVERLRCALKPFVETVELTVETNGWDLDSLTSIYEASILETATQKRRHARITPDDLIRARSALTAQPAGEGK